MSIVGITYTQATIREKQKQVRVASMLVPSQVVKGGLYSEWLYATTTAQGVGEESHGTLQTCRLLTEEAIISWSVLRYIRKILCIFPAESLIK